MKKKLLSIGSIALLSVALVACNGEKEEVAEPVVVQTNPEVETPAPVEKTEVVPTGKVVEVTIGATNFEFDTKEIKANVGDTVKVTLKNASGLHGVNFDGIGKEVKNGETIEFVVTEAGEFAFNCSIPCGVGHDKMTGKLIVS